MSQIPTTSMLDEKPITKRFLERVRCKLEAESKAQDDKNYVKKVDRAAQITGLRVNALNAIIKGETINLTNQLIDRAVIHKHLYSFYLSKKMLPTTRQLFHALGYALPAHMDIASFRKLLYKMDFVWKKVGKIFVVLERPEVTYERYTFMKDILEYQGKILPIYFVEEWVVPLDSESRYDTTNTTEKDIIVFAFSKSEIVFQNSVLPPNRSEIDYKNWIVGQLIPHLEEESVIVVNTEHYYSDLFNYPTINSLKEEMTDWLERHEVPYDEVMSKVELWTLIQEYTDVGSKMTTLDTVIRSLGHIPLRIPRHMHLLSPGPQLYDLIKNEANFFDITLDQDERRDKIHSKMNSIDIAVLDKIINAGLKKYRTFLCDEIVLDEKLDLLLKKMESEEQEQFSDGDSDLPSDGDSD